jgi:hypothetical protein
VNSKNRIVKSTIHTGLLVFCSLKVVLRTGFAA